MANHTSKLGTAVNKVDMPIRVESAWGAFKIELESDGLGSDSYHTVYGPKVRRSFVKKEAAWLFLFEQLAALQRHAGVAADPDFVV